MESLALTRPTLIIRPGPSAQQDLDVLEFEPRPNPPAGGPSAPDPCPQAQGISCLLDCFINRYLRLAQG
ncbi:hypothetical protein BD779DRAFT_1541633 [Infundibulicybe gibba]|nr:hypothetical protein BD779DRAFT_1541633 [Infundibulicybe gibba]